MRGACQTSIEALLDQELPGVPRRSFASLPGAGVAYRAALEAIASGRDEGYVLVLVPDEDEDDGAARRPSLTMAYMRTRFSAQPGPYCRCSTPRSASACTASTTYRRAAFPRTAVHVHSRCRRRWRGAGPRRRPRSGASRSTTARPRAGPSSPTRTCPPGFSRGRGPSATSTRSGRATLSCRTRPSRASPARSTKRSGCKLRAPEREDDVLASERQLRRLRFPPVPRVTLYQVFRRPVPADIVAQNLANIPIPVRYSFIYDGEDLRRYFVEHSDPRLLPLFDSLKFVAWKSTCGGTVASTKRVVFI